jgi:hypothetical protein
MGGFFMTLDEMSVAFETWYIENKYSTHTLKNDCCIRNRIFRSHTKLGKTEYSPEITADFLRKYETNAIRNGFSRNAINRVQKIAALLNEYYETNAFVWKRNKTNKSTLNAHYEALLESYVEHEKILAKRTPAVIANISHILKTFLGYLQENDCAVITELSHKMIADYLVYISKPRPKSVAYNCYALRVFADFAITKELGCINIHDTIPSIPKRGRGIMPAFTTGEVDKILIAPDRSTVIGKRDFAMFAIASPHPKMGERW